MAVVAGVDFGTLSVRVAIGDNERGLLDSAGIDSDLTSLDAQQDILPGVGGTVILVREEDAAEARRMIEEYRQTPDELETAEFAINEEPPAES